MLGQCTVRKPTMPSPPHSKVFPSHCVLSLQTYFTMNSKQQSHPIGIVHFGTDASINPDEYEHVCINKSIEVCAHATLPLCCLL